MYSIIENKQNPKDNFLATLSHCLIILIIKFLVLIPLAYGIVFLDNTAHYISLILFGIYLFITLGSYIPMITSVISAAIHMFDRLKGKSQDDSTVTSLCLVAFFWVVDVAVLSYYVYFIYLRIL